MLAIRKLVSIFLIFFSFACFASIYAESGHKPNIIIIVADDLGWADVGYHDSDIKTPNIDQLCAEGIELDQHYVAPMCTPTRTGLLTGRYWSRFGNTTPSNTRVLPWDTKTLASELRSIGYHTSISGKWHLGSKPEWGPLKFGFMESYGSLAGGVNPINHLYKRGEYSQTWHRNDRLLKEEGHVTDLITREALRVIKENKNKPFFLYLPYTAVHTPFDEPKEWLDSTAHIKKDRRQYAACAQHMDNSIGQVVASLKKHKLYNNTIILFFSDNGGTNGDDSLKYPDTKVTSKINGLNRPLRGWKKQVYEGGTRVPAFMTWKNKLKPKKLTTPISVTDWMPTLLSILNYKPSQELKWDGQNIWTLLKSGKNLKPSRVLYCKGIHGKTSSIRFKQWKLIVHHKQNPSYQLFNIEKDPYEKNNVNKQFPEISKELRIILREEQAKDNDAVPNLKLSSK